MGDACKMAMQFGHLQASGGPGGHGSIPVIVHPTQPAMSQVFAFGERRPEFPVPVLNERAVLAAAMLYLVVIRQLIGPVNLIVCATCLVLLFQLLAMPEISRVISDPILRMPTPPTHSNQPQVSR